MTATYCPMCRGACSPQHAICPGCGTARPEEGWQVDPMVGQVIEGKFRIDRRLSAGGFGAVFLATQLHGTTELGTVVLKFLHREHAHDANIRKRFVREAKAARELTDPHVVRVFDLGFSSDGIPFMVQEYVVGAGLPDLMAETQSLPVERVVRIGMQVAEAMAEAHAKGILHRDLKPENLIVTHTSQGDFVKILDFGIARLETGGTATTSLIGTPRYMAPEQIRQKDIDGRCDIFALGVILFELLTGQPPIHADSEMQYIALNLDAPPRDARELRPDVPAALAGLLDRMMAKSPSDRPAGMAEVCELLRACVGRRADAGSGARRLLPMEELPTDLASIPPALTDGPAPVPTPIPMTRTPLPTPSGRTLKTPPAGPVSPRPEVLAAAPPTGRGSTEDIALRATDPDAAVAGAGAPAAAVEVVPVSMPAIAAPAGPPPGSQPVVPSMPAPAARGRGKGVLLAVALGGVAVALLAVWVTQTPGPASRESPAHAAEPSRPPPAPAPVTAPGLGAAGSHTAASAPHPPEPPSEVVAHSPGAPTATEVDAGPITAPDGGRPRRPHTIRGQHGSKVITEYDE